MNPHQRPRVDADTLAAVQEAIELLALLRGAPCSVTDPHDPPDPGDVLCLLQSIRLQADDYLAELAALAHHHGYTTPQRRRLLGLDDPTASEP